MHERLAVASRIQRQCVKMKEPRDACTCFTVAACHCCKCAQDCRGQVNISVFVFWFYTQHDFLQFLYLHPAFSRMHGLLPPSTPLAHLDTQPLPSRRVQDKDDACKRRGLCLRPVQNTHTHTHNTHTHTQTHTQTHTHSFRQTKSMRALTVNPASGS